MAALKEETHEDERIAKIRFVQGNIRGTRCRNESGAVFVTLSFAVSMFPLTHDAEVTTGISQ